MKTILTTLFLLGSLVQAQTIKNDTIVMRSYTLIGQTINGVKQGYFKTYIGSKKNLLLYAEGAYNNDQKEGKWITYGNEDSSKSKEEHFKNDLLNGEEIFFYPNGKIQSKGNYINDEPDGEHLSYYESGIIKSMENYKEGETDGKFIEYFENGKPHIIGSFINDVLFGEFIEYDTDGKVLNEGSFIDGDKMGKWTETVEVRGGLGIPETIQVSTIWYHVNKNDYKVSKGEETRKIYNKDGGKLIRTEYYKEGNLIKTEE
jgi:antitoxin component YwqK of YwqJK toxin-antitoxin module